MKLPPYEPGFEPVPIRPERSCPTASCDAPPATHPVLSRAPSSPAQQDTRTYLLPRRRNATLPGKRETGNGLDSTAKRARLDDAPPIAGHAAPAASSPLIRDVYSARAGEPLPPIPPRLPAEGRATLRPGMADALRTELEALEQEFDLARQDTLAVDQDDPVPRRLGGARIARLDARRHQVAQRLAAISEEDPAPGLEANATYAKIWMAKQQMLNTGVSLSVREAELLHALLSLGEIHNRLHAHNGAPRGEMPDLHYADMANDEHMAAGMFISNATAGKDAFLITANGTDLATLMPHEGEHDAQLDTEARAARNFEPRPSRSGRPSTHARGGRLEVQRMLPNPYMALPEERQVQDMAFGSHLHDADALEIGANVEGNNVSSNLVSLTPHSQDHIGLTYLVPLLARVAAQLNDSKADSYEAFFDAMTNDPDASDDATGWLRDSPIVLSPRHHPEAGPLVERLLFNLHELGENAQSAAWMPNDRWQLEYLLIDPLNAVQNGSLEGLAALKQVCEIVEQFKTSLEQTRGVALRCQDEGPDADVQARSDAYKHQSMDAVKARLSAINRQYAPEEEYDVEKLPGAVDAAKQGEFSDALREVSAAIDADQVPSHEAVGRAVASFMARLIGLQSMEELPPELTPAVHLFEAASLNIPFQPGLTAPPAAGPDARPDGPMPPGAEPRRKARADVSGGWLLHIPLHLLQTDAEEREERLAGLAIKMACTVSRALSVRDSGDEMDFMLDLPGAFNGRLAMPAYNALFGDFPDSYAAHELDASGRPLLEKKPVPSDRRYGSPSEALLASSSQVTYARQDPPVAPTSLRTSARQVSELKQRCDRYIAENPDSAAAALRLLMEYADEFGNGALHLKHLVERPALKALARQGGEQGQAAQRALESLSVQRMDRSTAALVTRAFRKARPAP